jgi:acyl dehydratase
MTTAPLERIYPEDLHPGQQFELGAWRVTSEQIVDFASTWDPLPLHTVEEEARRTSFGGLIASGVHTLGIFQRLAVLAFFSRSSVIAGRGLLGTRLPKPVRPETTLSGWLLVEHVALRDGKADVNIRGTLRDEEDDIVFEMTADVIMARRPSDR